MTRSEMYNELQKLDAVIGRSNYAVVYSGALVAHGLKETCNDIDINVSNPVAWDVVVASGYKSVPYRNALQIKFNDKIDLHFGGMMTKPEVEFVDGFQFQTIKSVIAEKKARGRDKDWADVRLIEDKLIEFWKDKHQFQD